jgi:hypothetical protein
VLPKAELERYCELVAALKLRTTNKKGRHLSTARAIELLEDYGVETPVGLVRVSKGLLSKTTVNAYLNRLGLDQTRLTRQPAAVRFQAEHSNDCWQFDLSPSDLKQVEAPLWIEAGRGEPTLMLFSVVDDRSGVGYQEYRCVYGEDAESALRFLFNAMAPKADPEYPFQGRPQLLYLDNGPVAKSHVFQNVMQALGIAWQTHLPAGKDGRRVTARAKAYVSYCTSIVHSNTTGWRGRQPRAPRALRRWRTPDPVFGDGADSDTSVVCSRRDLRRGIRVYPSSDGRPAGPGGASAGRWRGEYPIARRVHPG